VIESACKHERKSSKQINMHVGEASRQIVCAKQFHACDSGEIETKTKAVLGQASRHVNDIKSSKKSIKHHSHKKKHKK